MNPVLSETDKLLSPDITLIDSMLNSRDESTILAHEIERIFSRLLELTSLSTAITVVKNISSLAATRGDSEKNRRVIDEHYWLKLIDDSNYSAILTTSQYRQHKSQITKECPEFTREIVVGTFVELYRSRFLSIQSAIAVLHSELYPQYSNNDGFRFKKKTIITNVFDGPSYSCFSNGQQKVSDFVRYLKLLDGKYIDELSYANSAAGLLEEAKRSGLDSYQFDQCEIRIFKNGNIHLLLDGRLDLLDRLNIALSNYHGKSIPSA